MDIAYVEGKYAGRAALLAELAGFLSYYKLAKRRDPERIYVRRAQLGPLLELAKKDKVAVEPLVYLGIPVVVQ